MAANPRRRRRAATVLALGAVLSACADDVGTVTKAPDTTTARTTSSTRERSDSGSGKRSGSTADVEVTTTTSPFGDTIDLSRAPDVLIVDSTGVFYFSDLRKPAVVRADATDSNGGTFEVSPDGTLVAVAVPGDAVRPARLELVSATDGRQVRSFDIDADTFGLVGWSPDSAAVATAGRNTAYAAYRLDGTVQPLTNRPERGGVVWARGAATSVVDCAGCSPDQLTDSDNVPVAIAQPSDSNNEYLAGTWNPDTGTVDRFEGDWGRAADADACPVFTIIRSRVGETNAVAVYGVDRRVIVPIPEPRPAGNCPLPAPDGTRAAFALADGGTAVVDTTTGRTAKVARQGVPLAWSKDGTEVLVQGNGTFRVSADGSGGKEASVTLRSACPIGRAGKVLASTDTGLVVYDVDTDSAKDLGPFRLGETCSVSADGTWAVSGSTLVDLSAHAATTLRRTDPRGRALSGRIQFVDPSWSGTPRSSS